MMEIRSTEIKDLPLVMEIYDYARAGTAYSYQSGEEMMKYTEGQVIDMILSDYKGKAIFLLAAFTVIHLQFKPG